MKFTTIKIAITGIVLAGIISACSSNASSTPNVTGKQQVCNVKDATTGKTVQVPAADCQPTTQAYNPSAFWFWYLIMSNDTRQSVSRVIYTNASSGDGYNSSTKTITEENGDTVDEDGHTSAPVHVNAPADDDTGSVHKSNHEPVDDDPAPVDEDPEPVHEDDPVTIHDGGDE
jgi:hypothetical protein